MQPFLRPYFRRRSLLTPAEQQFYCSLRTVARGCAILVKVRLADLIGADDRHKFWQANFRRICSKHIDFVLCDPEEMRPIAAIELDDSSHFRADRQKRDEDVNRLFKAVRLPLVRVPVQEHYAPEELSQRFIEALSANEITRGRT